MPYQKNSSPDYFWENVAEIYRKGLPFTVYRKPNEQRLVCISQKDSTLHTIKDLSESGFVFAPFNEENQPILIPIQEYSEATYSPSTPKSPDNGGLPLASKDEREFHLELISKGLAGIRASNFTKVVLSRRIAHPYQGDPIIVFKRILDTYLSAFCYLWYHPKIGLWLGATPELLVKVESETFQAMSLAGTRKYNAGGSPEWSPKEVKEQALVTDYLWNTLKHETQKMQISPLESVRAGSLWHLRTTVSGILKSGAIGKLIRLIHPTPAVCGIPKQASKNFILANENYDREFYTGFLGELNFGSEKGKQSALYVNLRCMQCKDGLVLLYVGGGITEESIVEDEWLETVEKSRTMFRVLYDGSS